MVMRLLAAGLAVDAVGVDLEQDGDAVPVGKVLGASRTNPFWRACPGAHGPTKRRHRSCSRSDVD